MFIKFLVKIKFEKKILRGGEAEAEISGGELADLPLPEVDHRLVEIWSGPLIHDSE